MKQKEIIAVFLISIDAYLWLDAFNTILALSQLTAGQPRPLPDIIASPVIGLQNRALIMLFAGALIGLAGAILGTWDEEIKRPLVLLIFPVVIILGTILVFTI